MPFGPPNRLPSTVRYPISQLPDRQELLSIATSIGKVVVEELAHRLKNKIATIQSIVSYQLRGHLELRDAIVGRLVALSGTDDLIIAAQGQGADLRDLLTVELRAYEASRILIAGPAVFLPTKLALSMTLLVHELATNAAKYGARSRFRRQRHRCVRRRMNKSRRPK